MRGAWRAEECADLTARVLAARVASIAAFERIAPIVESLPLWADGPSVEV